MKGSGVFDITLRKLLIILLCGYTSGWVIRIPYLCTYCIVYNKENQEILRVRLYACFVYGIYMTQKRFKGKSCQAL